MINCFRVDKGICIDILGLSIFFRFSDGNIWYFTDRELFRNYFIFSIVMAEHTGNTKFKMVVIYFLKLQIVLHILDSKSLDLLEAEVKAKLACA